VRGKGIPPLQIDDDAGHLQDPRVSPGAQAELGHRLLQEAIPLLIDLTVTLEVPRGHLGIAKDPFPLKPLMLDRPCPLDPLPDRTGRFPLLPLRQITVPDCRNLDVDVDPVEQGAGDAGAVPLDLRDGAGTFMQGIAVKAARAPLRDSSLKKSPL